MARKERGRCFIARITDYQAREEMTTQGTGVEIDPQTASTSGRILSDIGRGIEGASEKLLQVQKVAETTRAQNEHEKALLSVETDFAKEDLSSKTPEQLAELKSKYSTRINEARSKSADHISMPGWKRDWNAEQQHNSNITQANIDSLFLKKYVDNAKGQLEDFINIQGKKYVETRNQPERVNSVLELTTKLEEAEKSGFLTHAAGEKLKIETLKKWDEAHVLHSINNNPYQALADL